MGSRRSIFCCLSSVWGWAWSPSLLCGLLLDRLGEGPALNPILVEYPESLCESCGDVLDELDDDPVDVMEPVVPLPLGTAPVLMFRWWLRSFSLDGRWSI